MEAFNVAMTHSSRMYPVPDLVQTQFEPVPFTIAFIRRSPSISLIALMSSRVELVPVISVFLTPARDFLFDVLVNRFPRTLSILYAMILKTISNAHYALLQCICFDQWHLQKCYGRLCSVEIISSPLDQETFRRFVFELVSLGTDAVMLLKINLI